MGGELGLGEVGRSGWWEEWCISIPTRQNKVLLIWWLKMTEIYCTRVLEVRSPKSRCRQDCILSEDSRGGSFFASSIFWWLPAIPDLP